MGNKKCVWRNKKRKSVWKNNMTWWDIVWALVKLSSRVLLVIYALCGIVALISMYFLVFGKGSIRGGAFIAIITISWFVRWSFTLPRREKSS